MKRRGRRFERLAARAREEVEDVLAELPENLRPLADRVPILFQSWAPPPDDDLLGLFEGANLAEDPAGPEDHPRITLFLEALEDMAEGDLDVFCKEVRVTLLHELGHYFGWDEEEVEERGLG